MTEFKPNSKLVFNYVKEHEDENLTAAMIAEAVNLPKKSVDGIITSAFQKKGFMERVPAEAEMEDGSHKQIKLIKLTKAGRELDIDATDAE